MSTDTARRCSCCKVNDMTDAGWCLHCDRICTGRNCRVCGQRIEEHRKAQP